MRGVDQIRRSSTGEAHERYLSGSLRDSSHKDPNHSVHTSINAATNNAVGSYPNDNNNGHKNANSTLNKKFAGHHNSLKSTTNSAVLANMAGPEARRMQRRLSASAGPGVDPLEVLNWKNACNNRINNNINNINLKAIGKNAVDDSNNNDDDDKQQQQRRNLFLSSSLGVGGYPTKTTPKIITKAPSLSTSNGGLPRDLVGCTILIPLKRRTTRSVDGLASVGVSENFNLHNSRGYHSDPDVDVDDLSYFCYDDDSEDTSVSEITFDEKAFQNPHLLDRRAVFQHSRRASASDVIAGGGGGIGMASMGGGMGMDSSSRNLNLSSQQQQNLKYVNLRTSRGPYDESSESEVDDDDDDDEEEEEEEEEEEMNDEEKNTANQPKLLKQKEKLTKSKRNKQKRHKALLTQLQHQKRLKSFHHQLAEVRKHAKDVQRAELLRLRRQTELSRLRDEKKQEPLGKNIWNQLAEKDPIRAPALPVALTEELEEHRGGTLRTVAPKGSLVTDRLESMAARNLIWKKKAEGRRIVQGKRRRKVMGEKGTEYLLL
mmetsp:Transcript_709/g.1514  ORF Transcript_709/g.1514 Transcript_709/m.1514 type:complete len:544 (+) Transcript_709:184-1815(+)